MLSQLRFSYDRASAIEVTSPSGDGGHNPLLDNLLMQSVRVRPETFPRLSQAIEKASARVLDEHTVPEVFLRSDSNIQACCYSSYSDRPLIVVSSALVELLSQDEIASVIGHEIGHWSFKHGNSRNQVSEHQGVAQLKMLAASRCAEISADRAGLVACNDVNTAISALVKVSTGLDEKNIRLDVQTFLKQYKEITDKGPNMAEAMSTHPFFLLRIRAMVLFSRATSYYEMIGASGKKGLSNEDVDETIHRDLRKISGLSIDEVDDDLVTEIMLLASFLVFAADGTFSKEEQQFFKETFGDKDFKPHLKMVKELGVKGLSLRLRQQIIALGGVNAENQERLKTFFSVLTQTFPRGDTEPLRATLNSLGYV